MTDVNRQIRRKVAGMAVNAVISLAFAGVAIFLMFTDRDFAHHPGYWMSTGAGLRTAASWLHDAWKLHRTPGHIRYLYAVSQLGKEAGEPAEDPGEPWTWKQTAYGRWHNERGWFHYARRRSDDGVERHYYGEPCECPNAAQYGPG